MEQGGLTPPLHLFTYADNFRPAFCIMAKSVAASGGYVNVLGLGDDTTGVHAVPKKALQRIAGALLRHSNTKVPSTRRGSAPVHCKNRAECSSQWAISKIRKFMSLLPYLKDFRDDALLLFVDGFDAVLEAPSLRHVADTFDQMQRKFGPLVGPSGGPVVFSGEVNCWPFPHDRDVKGSISGDYRADYVYRFGNETHLRGDEVCDYWLRRQPPGGGMGSSEVARFPFINSGVFMGRAGSLRKLFRLAVETLELHGDFEDQGLVYVMALRAANARYPWVPLVVDTSGELLASYHGVDIAEIARQQSGPQVCDFWGRVANGFYDAALMEPSVKGQEVNSRWATTGRWARSRWRQPLVAHFNGDKKSFFEENCMQAVHQELSIVGASLAECKVVDYPRRLELFSTLAGFELPIQRGLPLPLAVPSIAQVVGAAFRTSGSTAAWTLLLRRIRERLIVKSKSEVLVGQVSRSAAESPARWWHLGAKRWLTTSFGVRRTDAATHTNESRMPASTAATAGSPLFTVADVVDNAVGDLDLALVRRNETRCSHDRSVNDYCVLFASLRVAWTRLRQPSGLLWSEFRGWKYFAETVRNGEKGRYDRHCRLDAGQPPDTNVGTSVGQDAPCVGLAVADFLVGLPVWEAVQFKWLTKDGTGVMLAVKL
eukprot:TRINITY_DN48880_c0_g1_i1.p1 TRINITY_DN48880_c0_g1~~TRINITY_DN48880_c0_g1_i1.p1  ORF type:complete len:656 (-),score=69.25 TRINITY_DN48880_c0_g1_i1:78-2045(-)